MSKYMLPCDAETGGFEPEDSDLLTLYLAMMDENFNIVDELDLQLKPDDGRLPKASSGALAVNKINIAEHLKDPKTITYSEGREKLLAFLKKYAKKVGRTCNIEGMGHNHPFDQKFIWYYLIPKDEWSKLVHYGIIDTLIFNNLLKKAGYTPEDTGPLGTLVDFYKIPQREAHHAKGDTLMCVDVFKAQLNQLKSRATAAPQQDLISLLEQE